MLNFSFVFLLLSLVPDPRVPHPPPCRYPCFPAPLPASRLGTLYPALILFCNQGRNNHPQQGGVAEAGGRLLFY